MKGAGASGKGVAKGGEGSSPGAASSLFVDWLERETDPTEHDFERLCKKQPHLRGELTKLWRGVARYEAFRGEVLGPLRKPSRRASTRRRTKAIAKGAGALLLIGLAIGYWPVRARLEVAHDSVAAIESIKLHVDRALASVDAADAKGFLATAAQADAGNRLGPAESITFERWSASFAEAHDLLALAASASDEISERTIVRSSDRQLARDLGHDCDDRAGGSDPAIGRALARASASRPAARGAGGVIHGTLAADEHFRQVSARLRRRDGVPKELCALLDVVAGVASIKIKVVDLEAGGSGFGDAAFFVQEVSPTNVLGPATQVDWPDGAGSLAPGDWRITVVDPLQERHAELRVLAFPGDQISQVAFLRTTETVLAGMAGRPAIEILYALTEGATNPDGAVDAPQQELCRVEELWVDPCEVTCEEWARFAADLHAHAEWFDGAVPIDWPGFADASGAVAPEMRRAAVTSIVWEEAALYANWAGKRLATDREWMRIAGGAKGRAYPWGDEFAADCVDGASTAPPQLDPDSDEVRFDTAPVARGATLLVDDDRFLAGATPTDEGAAILRLADNVSEYTEDLDLCRDGANVGYACLGTYKRRWRGGNWFLSGPDAARLSTSGSWLPRPFVRFPFQGLRCVKTRLDGQLAKPR